MIQPALQAYSMGGAQAEPVMLDVASVTPDRVLLLDSYFTVVVWHGSTVAQWRKADYHLQEEYAHLKPLMEVWVDAKLPRVFLHLPDQPAPIGIQISSLLH